MCPNTSEPPIVFTCAGCGKNIFEGQDYYEAYGESYCEDCVTRETAKYERDDFYD